ncbi:MAG TPA: hypothetical protein EYQ35_03795 [candidate division UBP10 bacterium]|nr:hypothetical protein [Candidatus Binatota bacterium]
MMEGGPMYKDWFSLRDLPFRLSPDPDFIYFGEQHAEAFAHMRYGVDEGSGFVAVTGEVGSGKTTLVRALMRDLRDSGNLAWAYIFNPVLSPVELLQTINAELGLPSRSRSKKELTELLNEFLINQKADGGNTVIIVDEAQNLDPVVLEQLRLLSNLETETEKLIHIVLVGQPELRGLLARPDLRQLAQRITVRWHLEPLDREQLGEYMAKRLHVAGGDKATGLFDEQAMDVLYDFSGGIPRLINILAHRSLLVAWTRGRRSVGQDETVAARAELHEVRTPLRAVPPMGWGARLSVAAGVATAAAGVAFLLVWSVDDYPGPAGPPAAPVARNSPSLDSLPDMPGTTVVSEARAASIATPVGHAVPVVASLGGTSSGGGLSQRGDTRSADVFLRRLGKQPVFDGAVTAMSELFKAWGRRPVTPDESRVPSLDLDSQAEDRGLRYLSGDMTVALLRVVDLPLIVELDPGNGGKVRYVLLRGMDEERVLFDLGGSFLVGRAAFEEAWNGRGHLLWKDRESLVRSIGPGSGGPEVMRLQALLARSGHFDGAVNGIYDDALKESVRAFQSASGLSPNGVVDPLTQVVLYNADTSRKRPGLSDAMRAALSAGGLS